MARTLYVATTNQGKLRDFSAAAQTHGLLISPLPNLAEIQAPAEDQPSFEGNARLKAKYYSRFMPGEIVIADDSGLEVDALCGAPGVRSARYAEDAGFREGANPDRRNNDQRNNDERNNLYLLTQLAGISLPERSARYRAALAAARDGESLLTAHGAVEGHILTVFRGTGGFGYDPLFFLPQLGKTMAEIDLETKHVISHRGEAFRQLLSQLLQRSL